MKNFGFVSVFLLGFALALGGCGQPSVVPPTDVDLATPSGCSDDSQCGAPTPRCDLNTRACVPCLPAKDNCPKGQRCVQSNGSFACTASCVVDADCPRSDAGNPATCCAGHCFDLTSDTSNCGACSHDCLAPANATAACVGGMCTVGSCNLGFLNCDRGDNNGCEVNANTDDRNCGACGKACSAAANQSFACTNGSCTTACNAGFADCDANAANGCEVSTNTDGRNCGMCGTACALANASSVCKAGACAVDACSAGFDDCNMQPKDGCEVDLKADVTHCGNCANACMVANGVPVCRAGTCGIASCNMGFADCDSLVINGCEIATLADPKNCGACGRTCTGANSVQACQMGACQIASCSPGFSDCDMKPVTGCEVNVAADVMNCGGCGKVCPVPANAAASCANSTCGVGQCKFGFADCNMNAMDGCEVDLQTPQNCGACGMACAAPPNATAGCKVGMCGIGMCNNLFGDCDNNAQNGCEKNLSTDANNCGKCGAVCTFANAQGACLGGQCGIFACNQGFGDCDMNAGNGCEKDLRGDPQNCGSCGNVCPQNNPFCAAGVCSNILKTCLDIYNSGVKVNGTYTIDPDGNGGNPAFTTYCDMTTAGGGWTLLVNRLTESDNNGQPDLNKNTGVFDNTRVTNFTFDLTPFYANAKDFVFAVRHNNACSGCTISQYDSAISVPRSANNVFSISCAAIESVQATKLVGPSAGQVLTAFRCAGSLGWGACPNVCHWGVHGQNTLGDGAWAQNTTAEMHFPSAYSMYRNFVSNAGYCRSCGGGLQPGNFNPLSSTCCNSSGNPDNSAWTVWVR